jgi:hypothetical protein
LEWAPIRSAREGISPKVMPVLDVTMDRSNAATAPASRVEDALVHAVLYERSSGK